MPAFSPHTSRLYGSLVWVLALVALLPISSLAQTQLTPATPEPEILHVTDKLALLPDAQKALQDFANEKLNPSPHKNNTPTVYTLGAQQSFKVLKNVATSPEWETREFTLEATSNIANIWVADTELSNGHVTNDDIVALENALLVSTPAGSVNTSNGIVANNNAFFGNPPDVDGDGKVDILLYDITEGTSNSNSFIAGFVTPSDLSRTGGGNFKDILYLDTHPGVSNRPVNAVLATAAHEYQHLIHYNYDLNEQVFVNEGLSEWAETLNGYPARDMTFLSDPQDYNIRLLSWDTGSNILNDYQRAGLFTGYIAERIPTASVAAITRNPNRGRRSYAEAVETEGLVFEEVLKDYHTANYLNSIQIDAAFGYQNTNFNSVHAAPTQIVEGRDVTETPRTESFIEAGGVEYITWNNVTNFTFSIDTIDDFNTLRERITVRAILSEKDSEPRFEDLTLPLDQKVYAGSYDEITLLLIHTQADIISRVGLAYEAAWGSDVTGTTTAILFDNGNAASNTFFSLAAGANSAVATRFETPAGSSISLLDVSVAPYFLSQFDGTNVPGNAPRDITLMVWLPDDDGKPGEAIFSLDVTDPRPQGTASSALNHFTVDLLSYANQLSSLPSTIFIGYAEAGTDNNYMVVGPAAYSVEDRSYITASSGEWAPLWETQFTDGDPTDFPLEDTIVPIRATFLSSFTPTNDDIEDAAPDFALAPNFPNPFNQQTTINYAIPQPEHVEITVYNVLGQRIKTLISQFQPAGNYSITFQADSLPGGLYLYTLEAGNKRLARNFTIVH